MGQGSRVSICPASSFLLSPSSTCSSGSHFLLTQSLGPSSHQLPPSWNRPRPTSYSSPLSQLRHTSVCTLPPTRKVAKMRRMRGAAKRKLKATPLEVRDMVEEMWKLTTLSPPTSQGQHKPRVGNKACLLGKGEPSTPGNSLASSPIHPHPTVGFCCHSSLEEGHLLVQRAISELREVTCSRARPFYVVTIISITL